jgi:hypothetical protein
LAVSATNDGVERDLFCQTCLRLPRKHCRRCQTGIWAREWRKIVGSLFTTERPQTRFQSAQRRVNKANQRNSFPTDLWLIPTTLHAQ